MNYFNHNAVTEGRKRVRATIKPDARSVGALFMAKADTMRRRVSGALLASIAKSMVRT